MKIIEYLNRKGIRVIRETERDIWVLCPFHIEKKASMHINNDGIWYCFGCLEKGNFWQFISKIEGISFKEVKKRYPEIKTLLVPLEVPKKVLKYKKEELLEIYELSIKDFVPEVMRERGLGIEDFNRFGLRICLEPKLIGSINLFGWLIAPILDWVGEFQGLTCRKLSKKDKIFFHTTQNFFWREDLIQQRDFVILVEGIFDTIFLMKNGLNALAILGKKLSEKKLLRLIEFGFERIYVFLDGDAKKDAEVLVNKLQLLGQKTGIILSKGDPDELKEDQLVSILVNIETEKLRIQV